MVNILRNTVWIHFSLSESVFRSISAAVSTCGWAKAVFLHLAFSPPLCSPVHWSKFQQEVHPDHYLCSTQLATSAPEREIRRAWPLHPVTRSTQHPCPSASCSNRPLPNLATEPIALYVCRLCLCRTLPDDGMTQGFRLCPTSARTSECVYDNN